MSPRRTVIVVASITTVVLLSVCLLAWRHWPRRAVPQATVVARHSASNAQAGPGDKESSPTAVWAHNLRLLKGPNFRVYVRWIRGEMVRTRPLVDPSLDDSESFVLDIQMGVVHANIGDIANYLNTKSAANSPLKNISIEPDGERLKIHGTMHKVVSLPIEMVGTVSPAPGGLIRFHVAKLDVLKVPVKGLLRGFHIRLSDLVHDTKIAGITVTGNDIIFDTQQALPPPHIHGQATSVRVTPPDVEVMYGNAPDDEASLAQWHNFLRLEGGAIDFGKLTMSNVDLTMIDASQGSWFNLDLVHYEEQLINGYIRITPQAGLEIFMPDVDEKGFKKPGQISLEWLKNRNRSLPAGIPLQ